jgi:hypothetical protein
LKDSQLSAFVQTNAGTSVGDIAHRFRCSPQYILKRLRKLAIKMRITVDAQWRVFGPRTQSLKARARPTEAVASTSSQRRMLAERRVEQDRWDWIQNVERCWFAMQANAHPWIEDAEEQLRKIARQIGKYAEIYLVDSKVSATTRNKARQILEAAKAVRMAKPGVPIDWWVFAPFKWPRIDIDHLAEAMSKGHPAPSRRTAGKHWLSRGQERT